MKKIYWTLSRIYYIGNEYKKKFNMGFIDFLCNKCICINRSAHYQIKKNWEHIYMNGAFFPKQWNEIYPFNNFYSTQYTHIFKQVKILYTKSSTISTKIFINFDKRFNNGTIFEVHFMNKNEYTRLSTDPIMRILTVTKKNGLVIVANITMQNEWWD